MTVYGYTRVSTHDQAEDGVSLASQETQIKGYAMMKGWVDDRPIFFVEEGVSGSVPMCERPRGAELLAMVERGDHIVIAKLDRGFRNANDALSTLALMKERGVSIHCIDLGGDVTGNGISKLIFTILAAVAEMERERIAERIRDAKAEMRDQGKYGGGRRPYGYDVVDGKRVPRPDEQAVIREIVDLRGLGWGAARIATYMDQHGRACFFPMQVQRIIERECTA